MKALILVGGEATRLRPLTCNTPKAMVPVLNIPFLEHVIRYLVGHGVKEIVLAQGHQSQPIENYFKDGSQYGTKLIYVQEDKPLGTGGAIKNAQAYLDERFVVLNGDIFTDLDITAMLKSHLKHKAHLTIARTPVENPLIYGVIETDPSGRITCFREKPSPEQVTTNMINAGTYIFEPDVLSYIPPEIKFSIEHQLFAKLAELNLIGWTFDSSGYWIDIGTPEKYLQLNRNLLEGRSQRYPLTRDTIKIGEQCQINSSARVKGPVVIGKGCTIEKEVSITGPAVIGDGSVIREGSIIAESVIWQNVRVEPHVTLKNSIVANNCCLYTGCIIEGSVIGEGVTLPGHTRLKAGSKIWPVCDT